MVTPWLRSPHEKFMRHQGNEKFQNWLLCNAYLSLFGHHVDFWISKQGIFNESCEKYMCKLTQKEGRIRCIINIFIDYRHLCQRWCAHPVEGAPFKGCTVCYQTDWLCVSTTKMMGRASASALTSKKLNLVRSTGCDAPTSNLILYSRQISHFQCWELPGSKWAYGYTM